MLIKPLRLIFPLGTRLKKLSTRLGLFVLFLWEASSKLIISKKSPTLMGDELVLPEKKKRRIRKVRGDSERDSESEFYNYDFLLKKFYENFTKSENKKFFVPPPQIFKLGTKKTLIKNFLNICNSISRDKDHVLNFLKIEFGTIGSLTKDGASFNGKFSHLEVTRVLSSYVKQYVICGICYSGSTTLVKCQRLFFVQCHNCNSKLCVQK